MVEQQLAKMRTIKQLVKHYKDNDPESPISEWEVRRLVKSGELKHRIVGNSKVIIDLNYFDEFIKGSNNKEDENPNITYGTLRKVT